MTRRGSLAYYSVALVCGAFFADFALALYAFLARKELFAGIPSFLGFFALSLVTGALALFLFAWLLRFLLGRKTSHPAWQWALAGALLAPAVARLCLELYLLTLRNNAGGRFWLEFLMLGPIMLWATAWWLSLPVGAATGYLLARVHTRFLPASSDSKEP